MKKFKYILLSLMLFMFPVLNVLANTTTDQGEKKLVYIVGVGLFIIRIVVPVILIVIASFDLVKAMTQNDEREMKKVITGILPKVVSAIMIFLLPSLVSLLLTLTKQEDIWNDNVTCLLKPFECDVELWEDPVYSSSSSQGGGGPVIISDEEAPQIISITNDGGFVTVTVARGRNGREIAGYYFTTDSNNPTGNEERWISNSSETYSIAKIPGNYWVYVKDIDNKISAPKELNITINQVYSATTKSRAGDSAVILTTQLSTEERSNYNTFIAESVRSAGLFTKEGVATAGLAGIIWLKENKGVGIPYISNHTCFGQRYNVQFGSNPNWGKKIVLTGEASTTAQQAGGISTYCSGEYGGLDCQAFVGWSVHNGGFAAKNTWGSYGGAIKNCVTYAKKTDGSTDLRKCETLESYNIIKEMYKSAEIGDVLANNAHVMLVLQNDIENEEVYIMEGTTPVGINKYSYSTLYNSSYMKYWALVKMKNYYNSHHACLKDSKNNDIVLPSSWSDKRSSFVNEYKKGVCFDD